MSERFLFFGNECVRLSHIYSFDFEDVVVPEYPTEGQEQKTIGCKITFYWHVNQNTQSAVTKTYKTADEAVAACRKLGIDIVNVEMPPAEPAT